MFPQLYPALPVPLEQSALREVHMVMSAANRKPNHDLERPAAAEEQPPVAAARPGSEGPPTREAGQLCLWPT